MYGQTRLCGAEFVPHRILFAVNGWRHGEPAKALPVCHHDGRDIFSARNAQTPLGKAERFKNGALAGAVRSDNIGVRRQVGAQPLETPEPEEFNSLNHADAICARIESPQRAGAAVWARL
jgi:hypothetical protein